jgi:hypothetical protein
MHGRRSALQRHLLIADMGSLLVDDAVRYAREMMAAPPPAGE